MVRQIDRKGIDLEQKYYFPDNEPIWYIGESLSDRKELNEALNRDTIKIDNLNELVHNVDISQIGGEPYASLVITKQIPTELESNLSILKEALDIMPFVKVYEIDRDPLFEYGQYVPSLYKLKEMSFEKTRSASIKTYVDPNDKQAEIMRSLEIDLMHSRENEKALAEGLVELNKQKEELEKRIAELTIDIDDTYLTKIEKLESEIEDLNETITNLSIDLTIERDKSDNIYKDLQKKDEESSNKTYEIQALMKKAEEKDTTIHKLKVETQNLEDEIDKLNVTQRRLVATSVDEESIIVLNDELDREKTKVRGLEQEASNLNVNLKQQEFEIRNLQNTISNLRNGNIDVQTMGRTFTLDKGQLNKTMLIYIKVAEEIPFLKQYIGVLFKILTKSKKKKKGLLLVLKNDEGLDGQIFKDFSMISTLNDVKVNKDMYRLFPTSTMFTGTQSIDGEYDFILFVDYIKSNEYYLSSTSKEIYMTAVTHSKKISELNMKGLPISLDSESIVDIKYDPSIANRALKPSRDGAVNLKVAEWYKALNIFN